jgi:gluconolactonase
MVAIVAEAKGAGGQEALVQPGAKISKVADGFSFTEGPAANAEGDIYFTDIPTQKIYKWSWGSGDVSLYRENTGGANGLMFDAGGALIACEMDSKRVTRDDLAGNITVLADSWNNNQPHMPNDLWIDARGGIYFSDFSGPEASGNGGLQVYYLPPDGKKVTTATTDLTAPNGLIGTPDGKTLYITDPGVSVTYAYPIKSDGSLGPRTLFCNQSTDGMAMDENGNLYFSGDSCITVFSSDGKKIDEIAMPERSANLTFGGKERKTLFITTQSSVYTLEMTVKGAPTALDYGGK